MTSSATSASSTAAAPGPASSTRCRRRSCDLRRMPAVSMKRIGPSSVSTTVSIASRVVPGMSCTTARSSPISRLNSVDLPTFGRPTIATRRDCASARPRRRPRRSRSTSGNSSTSSSSRSPVPRPCSAVTGNGSPRPSETNPRCPRAAVRCRPCWRPAAPGASLAAATQRRSASSSVTPTVASTTRITTSASRTACSLCAAHLRRRGSARPAATRRCRRR